MPNRIRLSQRAQWAAGQPIGYLMQEALGRPELISLAAGFVDQQTLPMDAVQTAIEDIFTDPARGRAALQYSSTMGDATLRELILQRTLAADGASAAVSKLSIDRVMLTAGSNELLMLIGETLLEPGDIVLCTAPSYFVYLGGLTNLGARSYGVAVDPQGMIPEALDAALERLSAEDELAKVKAVYVTSYYDNPSSVTLAADRRQAIVETVRRWSRHGTIYVIEDAVYRELRYEGEDIPSLLAADDRLDTVIHTGSFSKTFSPGVRVGWGILPEQLVEPIYNLKGNIDFGSPHLSQQIMSSVLKLGLYDDHVARLRDSYRLKRDAMLEAADQHLGPVERCHWLRATGGLYVWLGVDDVDTGAHGPLFQAALAEDVLYVPGAHCYPQEGDPPRHDRIRLSFGVQSPERIREGMAALARAVQETTVLETPHTQPRPLKVRR